jgi:hypothetical protein
VTCRLKELFAVVSYNELGRSKFRSMYSLSFIVFINLGDKGGKLLIGECNNAEILPPLLLLLKLWPGSVFTRDCAGHEAEFLAPTRNWLAMAFISGATVADAGERFPVASVPNKGFSWFPVGTAGACEASFRICLRSVRLMVTVSAVVCMFSVLSAARGASSLGLK